jgi:hypothetical protein
MTDPAPPEEEPASESPPAIEPPPPTVGPLATDPIRRAVRATRDVGVGYGIAWSRAGLRAAIGLGKAGTDVALKVLDQGPVGEAAGSLADRLEPAAQRGRREREATADQVEAVVGRVVDEVVAVLDIDGIIREVDIDGIVQRVDIDGIVGRIDIDEIIGRVDIDGIVRRTEVGTLIVQSTGGMFTQFLDFVRSLGVSFDGVSDRIVDRVVHRGRRRPAAPVLLGGNAAGVVEAQGPSVVEARERPA